MSEFAIGNLLPKQQKLSRFRRAAQVMAPIFNRSSARARFRLEGVDAEGVCHVEFQLPGQVGYLVQQGEFWLAPEEGVTIPVRISLPPNALTGLGRQTYRYTLTVAALSGQPGSRSALGQVTRNPLIGPWLLSLLAVGVFSLLLLAVPTTIATFSTTSPPFERAEDTPSGANPGALRAVLAKLSLNSVAPSPVENLPKNRSDLTYEEIFQEIGPQYGLDWRLLAEIAYQESRMNRWAIGRDNDMGLMQIIPSTWNEWAPKVGVSDPYDPYSNVLVAAAYLAYVREYARSNGYAEDYWMLVGYNWGPENLRQLFAHERGSIPPRQDQYAMEILRAKASGVNRWQQVEP